MGFTASTNQRKHGVSFDEACTVFDDTLAQIFVDEDHSDSEQREIMMGASILRRLLVVSFVERIPGRVRIISARAAKKREQKDYEENVHG